MGGGTYRLTHHAEWDAPAAAAIRPGARAPASRMRLTPRLTALAVIAGIVAVAVLSNLGLGSVPAGLVAAGPSATPAVASASAVPPTDVPGPSSAPSGPAPSSGPSSAPSGPAPSIAASSPAPSDGELGPGPSAAPVPSPSASPAPGGIPVRQLQARLDRLREKMDIPGVSVAIQWDDGREWAGVSGLRDVNRGQAVTTDTAFSLASVSKTLTAAVVLQLVDEGRLSLDDRVAPLLPGYALHPRITVRHLLDHTSGLPDYFLNGKIDRPLQSEPDAAWSAHDAWDYVLGPRKRFLPGKVWYYSNTNYLLLGELVEAVTGRPLAEEVRARLLDPLALETAWYQGAEEPRAKGTEAYRLADQADGSIRIGRVAPRSDVMPFRSVVTAAGGAGSVAMNAIDAARWMRAFAGGEVVAPTSYRAMLADVSNTVRKGAEVPYGLGIQACPWAAARRSGTRAGSWASATWSGTCRWTA